MTDNQGTRVLLVDDDQTFRKVMSAELSRRGFDIITAANGAEALARTGEFTPEVVLLDMRLPDMDGIDVLKQLRERGATEGVIVLTGHGTIDTAIQAVRLGAHDYLEKPCPIEKLIFTIRKTAKHGQLVRRQKVLEDGYAPPDVGVKLIGSSPAFNRMLEHVGRIASTEATCLILGETGVGKEMVAMLVHAQSPRKDGPFVVVDCAGLHEELLQSELFGHERGAFTGATRQKHGLFEVANGGSLFLDEIGEAGPEIQAKLLRVLETSRFRRVGGTTEIAVDVRVISATNRNLSEAIKRGHFRGDLYYRLATLTLDIPPLRDRVEDILLLVEHFRQQFNSRFSQSREFGEDALMALENYPWPGNVRELAHVVEQAIVLASDDVIAESGLPSGLITGHPRRSGPGSETEPLPLKEIERRHVLAVVDQVGGNRAQAARLLQISERNLYRLLDKYGWRPS